MSDQDSNAALLAALQQQLAGMQQIQQPAQTPTIGMQPTAINIPIKINTPAGDCRCYLTLPAEVAANPQALLGALQQLQSIGWPLDIWQPRQQGGWNRSGGGWNQGGGGWNRGSGGRW